MRLSIHKDHIYLSPENVGDKLQIQDAITQLQRYKIAHQAFSDSLNIYVKSLDQYLDEKKING